MLEEFFFNYLWSWCGLIGASLSISRYALLWIITLGLFIWCFLGIKKYLQNNNKETDETESMALNFLLISSIFAIIEFIILSPYVIKNILELFSDFPSGFEALCLILLVVYVIFSVFTILILKYISFYAYTKETIKLKISSYFILLYTCIGTVFFYTSNLFALLMTTEELI